MACASPLLPRSTPDQDRLVWYLAYGSNLASKTFREDRQMSPQAAAAVGVPGWRLTMSSAGFPYREPAFASIEEIPGLPSSEKPENEKDREVALCGTAYLITWAQWIQIIASEGGGIAYEQAVLSAQPIRKADRQRWGETIRVWTLVSTLERFPEARPSARYMGLIVDGAQAAEIPRSYIEHIQRKYPCYQPKLEPWARIGAALFLAFWTPLLTLLSILTRATARTGPGENGHVPDGVRALVRFAMYCMWWVHDVLWAGIWGRGDGLDSLEPDAWGQILL
ncbi:hypothetical protein CNMCM7691_002265 [Aspergillus felis]|uniref:gamma-glutamylcyclotransferase n=1 Tax=Aspergillus felis TaxID=1287682 RepID=A0A8H6QMK0_9EURO|nr:hypothetical protein CNMCM7691_002265 [Aspergillus felis]